MNNFHEQRLKSGSPSISSIVQTNSCRAKDSITIRGQVGDGRDLKPEAFLLTCPRCRADKEASRCTLYAHAAKVLYCTTCKHSMSSTRWQCNHGIRWLDCPVHREVGFRCKGLSQPKHRKSNTLFQDVRHKARLKRLKRLGTLGRPEDIFNSISCRMKAQKKETTNKNNIEQDARERFQISKGGGPCSDRPSISPCPAREHVLHTFRNRNKTLMRLVLAKKPWLNNGVADTVQFGSAIFNNKPEFRGSITPSKRLRVMPTCISRVRGSCATTGWSIDQYCEACHG